MEALYVLDEILRMKRVVSRQGLNVAGMDALYVMVKVLYACVGHKFSFYEVEDETLLDKRQDIQADF